MCGYDGYTELSITTPKARKEYRCVWCNEKILIKEKHVARTYIFERDFNSDRMHDECFAAMKKTPHDELCDGFMAGEFIRGKPGARE